MLTAPPVHIRHECTADVRAWFDACGHHNGRGAGGEVGEGLTKQNCKGQSGEGAIFVAALVATILNKVQDNRVTLLHSSQD